MFFQIARFILLVWLFRDDFSNTLRVLVATDCHLGYMEKDEIRRHDSFQAFEEICSIAEQKKVGWASSFVLLICYSPAFSCYSCLPFTFHLHGSEQVDFILLGGDLFHENKPSRTTLVKTIEILRRYCLNDHPVQFQVVSDQTMNFANMYTSS